MSMISDLRRQWGDANELAEQCRSQLEQLLYPILRARGHNVHHESITDVVDTYTMGPNRERIPAIEITTEWSTRSCANTSTYLLPVSVIEAADPIDAAKAAAAEQARLEHQRRIEHLRSTIEHAQCELERLESERS